VTPLLEVIGGPMDGDVVELPDDVSGYVALHDGGCGADSYRVEWWAMRDGDGREMWRRRCLVWVERDA
jgi:hypothetical protein